MEKSSQTVEERFWSKVDKTDTCWLWQGLISSAGFGRFGGKLPHRLSYILCKDTLESKVQIRHKCKNKICVNPTHLYVLTIENRFLDKVNKTETCWLWTASLNRKGYGQFGYTKETGAIGAHRASYELFRGPITEGLHVDHLCRIRNCVRPDHLELVTQQENTRRGNDAYKNCINGHPLSGDNLRASDLKRGERVCIICSRKRGREWARKQREKQR